MFQILVKENRKFWTYICMVFFHLTCFLLNLQQLLFKLKNKQLFKKSEFRATYCSVQNVAYKAGLGSSFKASWQNKLSPNH